MALPNWTRSIRFRLTVLYSGVLFALAALLVGALYLGLSLALRNEPISRGIILLPNGLPATVEVRSFERRVNEHTLESLRNFSFAGLGALFFASLGVGWVIAGRVLAPIERISGVAREIQATNLSRRIDLEGPDDELKRLADTFDAMLARLDTAFERQRQFVADASHELRNPLAVIRTNVDVVLADPDAEPESLRQTATVVRRASERMTRLVDDLLALARLEAPSARSDEVELGELMCEAADELDASARRQDVALERASAEPITVVGDREGLKRAVANLLSNAIRHSAAGSRVRLAAGREQGWAWLAVADEGPGIGAEHREKVFDRFYRVDRGRARGEGGSGLGLAIVREIVEGHGGRVTLHSETGSGALFALWLPLSGAAGQPPEGPPPLVEDGAVSSRARGGRVAVFSRGWGRRL